MTTTTAGITMAQALPETHANIARRVSELADLRRAAATATRLVDDARAEFEEHYAAIIRDARESKAAVDAAEIALRSIVAQCYAAVPDKKPTAGIEVKIRSTLSYDKADAFAWARETHMALVPESLDVKAFEKIAKATPLPFVKTVEEPMVTIATDLDKALAVAAVTTPAQTNATDVHPETSTSADARAEA